MIAIAQAPSTIKIAESRRQPIREVKPTYWRKLIEVGVPMDIANTLAWAIARYEAVRKVPTQAQQTLIREYCRFICRAGLWQSGLLISSFNATSEQMEAEARNFYLQAIEQGRTGNLVAALQSLNQAVQLKPDYADAWYKRGLILSTMERHEEALTNYDQALKHLPNNAELWNSRGNVLFHLARYEEAIASYDRALEEQLDNSRIQHNRTIAFMCALAIHNGVQQLDNLGVVLKPHVSVGCR